LSRQKELSTSRSSRSAAQRRSPLGTGSISTAC
jgi:hypothetical protein